MKTIEQLKIELKQAKIEAYKNAKDASGVIAIWKQDKRTSIPKDIKRKFFCYGCRQNYYNGEGAKECWCLDTAKLRQRKIYRSLDSVKPEEVITLDCYTQQYH
jgi:hypothetical protein